MTPDGSTAYTYNAQNKLIKGEKSDGQSSTYTYNALGTRVKNVQVKKNINAPYANNDLKRGSANLRDYLKVLTDGRATWQPVWETEIGTTVQNNFETVTTEYVVDYMSPANRDIMAYMAGGDTARYVYDDTGRRISAEFSYADGTNRGEGGENIASDTSVNQTDKIWYRSSALGSTLFAVDEAGDVRSHVSYDEWGKPLTETDLDLNYSGIDNINNYTGYTYDEVLDLYFAQNRFYDPENHRFTQEDVVKDGNNWYAYCDNSPLNSVDPLGLRSERTAVRKLVESLGGQITYTQVKTSQYIIHTAKINLFGQEKYFSAYTCVKSNRYVNDENVMYGSKMYVDTKKLMNFVTSNISYAEEYRLAVSSLIGFVPGVGDAKDLQEFVTGVDIVAGTKLTGIDRAASGVAVFVPFVSGTTVRVGLDSVKLEKYANEARKSGKAIKGTSSTVNLSRNVTKASELDTGMLSKLKNEGTITSGGRSGGNRPLTGTPNSYVKTDAGHTFVYDSEGKLIYDISGERVKMTIWDKAPNGNSYPRDLKLEGSVPSGLLK